MDDFFQVHLEFFLENQIWNKSNSWQSSPQTQTLDQNQDFANSFFLISKPNQNQTTDLTKDRSYLNQLVYPTFLDIVSNLELHSTTFDTIISSAPGKEQNV